MEGPGGGGGGARGAAGVTGSTGGGGGGREVTGCRRGGAGSGADAVEGGETVARFGGTVGSRIRLITFSES